MVNCPADLKDETDKIREWGDYFNDPKYKTG